MSLAQVAYRITRDPDFAAQWKMDPEAALQSKGFRLSHEELEFLSTGLHRTSREDGQMVRLSEIVKTITSWR
jgi:hypothetical protein